MSNIKRHNYQPFDLYISNYGALDLYLALEQPYYNTVLPEHIVFDVSGATDVLCNYVEVSGETIYVCGTGYTENIICMANAVPDTLCNGLSGNTFSGGFYQGHYKLQNHPYDALPDPSNGWSVEMVLRRGGDIDCGENGLLSNEGNFLLSNEGSILMPNIGGQMGGLSLNELFPDNSGMFFYWGLKNEDPYCRRETSGITSCEGVLYDDGMEIIETSPFDTDFLLYTKQNVCNGITKTKTIHFPQCCEGIEDNAMGFRLTDAGEIEARLFTLSGECVSGTTEHSRILSSWTSDVLITDNEWKHIVIKWEPYEYDRCQKKKVGRLSVYLNGKRKFFIDAFPQFEPYALDMHDSLQYGIPYNISIGGGTLGNMFNELPLLVSGETKDVCRYCTAFCSNEVVTGITIDGTTYVTEEISGTEIEMLTVLMEQFFGGNVVVKKTGRYQDHVLILITTERTVNALKLQSSDIPFYESGCITFVENRMACDVLKEHFAGTFIGQIDCFRFYGGALNIQTINGLFLDNCAGIEPEKYCC